jgi:hypothetical protein
MMEAEPASETLFAFDHYKKENFPETTYYEFNNTPSPRYFLGWSCYMQFTLISLLIGLFSVWLLTSLRGHGLDVKVIISSELEHRSKKLLQRMKCLSV